MSLFSKQRAHGLEDAIGLAVFTKTPDGILVLNGQEIVACNDAAVRLLRCKSKADILSRRPSDFAAEVLPDGRRSADCAKEQIAKALKEGYARFEWVHRRIDGTTFPSQVTLIPVEIDGRRLLLSFWEDLQALVAVREEKKRAMGQLASDFESSVGEIVKTLARAASDMQSTASSMTTTAEAASRRATAVAAASGEASTNVQTVASAAEELSSSVAEISRQVASSSAIAAKAVGESERADAFVKGLTEAAQKISAVTSLISNIAGQTNLLALN